MSIGSTEDTSPGRRQALTSALAAAAQRGDEGEARRLAGKLERLWPTLGGPDCFWGRGGREPDELRAARAGLEHARRGG